MKSIPRLRKTKTVIQFSFFLQVSRKRQSTMTIISNLWPYAAMQKESLFFAVFSYLENNCFENTEKTLKKKENEPKKGKKKKKKKKIPLLKHQAPLKERKFTHTIQWLFS